MPLLWGELSADKNPVSFETLKVTVYSPHTIVCHYQSNMAFVYMGIKYYLWGILPTCEFSGQIFRACPAASGLFW